jgi:hypothetical protein
MRFKKILVSVDRVPQRARPNELGRILNTWTKVLQRYLERTNDPKNDFPWLYSERSCVGMLSVAAWQAGGLGLEEWGTEKRRKGSSYRGRNDLYLQLGEGVWYAEAKHAYINLDSDDTITKKKIKKTIVDSKQSAKLMKRVPKSQRLAITFLAPACISETSDPEGRETWNSFIQSLEERQPSFMASLFHSEPTTYGREQQPLGIVLFGQHLLPKN